jgi:hypothetical protein
LLLFRKAVDRERDPAHSTHTAHTVPR